jgi:hypothetical protein
MFVETARADGTPIVKLRSYPFIPTVTEPGTIPGTIGIVESEGITVTRPVRAVVSDA